MKKIRLQPFVSHGETILRADGTMEVVPMQLFQLGSGGAVLRIGDSTYWFNEDGSYDGPEHSFPGRRLSREESMEVEAMLEGCREERGRAPETTYFGRGSRGWEAEIADWPSEARRQEEVIERAETIARLSLGEPTGELKISARRFRKGPKN